MKTYLAIIDYTLQGIPCQIGVLDYEPFVAGNVSGPPEHCYPDEGGQGEYEILDLKGRPALWLERKMTRKDHDEVDQIIFRYMEDAKDDYYE